MFFLRDPAHQYRWCPGWQREIFPLPATPGCHAIQVQAQSFIIGWMPMHPAVVGNSGRLTVATDAQSVFDELSGFSDRALVFAGTLAVLRPPAGLDQYWRSSGGSIGAQSGWLGPKSNAIQEHQEWSVWADVGDGEQWYDVAFDVGMTINADHGLVISFTYADSCGGTYYYSLDPTTGDITESGTLAGAIADANETVDSRLLLQISECPFAGSYGSLQTEIQTPPNRIIYANGHSCDYVEWEADADGLTAGLSFHTIDMAENKTFRMSVTIGRNGRDFLFIPSWASQAAKMVKLDNLNHSYAGSISIPRDGIYDANTGAVVGDRIQWDTGYTVQPSGTYAPWAYVTPSDRLGLFPLRWIIRLGGPVDLPLPAYAHAGIYWSLSGGGCAEAAFAERCLIGILGLNCQRTQGQDQPQTRHAYDNSDGKCATEPVEMVDCVSHFLPVGYHILEPETPIFDFGRMTIQRHHTWTEWYDDELVLHGPECHAGDPEDWGSPCC